MPTFACLRDAVSRSIRGRCDRWRMGVAAMAFWLGAGGVYADGPAGSARRPNVLFIVSDDLNCKLSCYGDPTSVTPNLDRLAERGMRFDRAYCNYPVCNASRTSFLSGRYPELTKVFRNGTSPRSSLGDYRFLPEFFHDHGYYTAGMGKIPHGTFESEVSWDSFSDPANGKEEEDGEARPRKDRKRSEERGEEPVPFAWDATDRDDSEEEDGKTSRGIAKQLAERREQPFFLAAGFHRPHLIHIAPKKYFDLYPTDRMPLPAPDPNATSIPEIALPPHYFTDLTDNQHRAIRSHYLAAVRFMDAQVGLLLDEMDRQKLWEDTIVIFFSDHGWHLGEHGGMYAKMSTMEESARVPFIVAAPGMKPGICKQPAELVDVFPTLAELCGLPQPTELQGRSLVPQLKEPATPKDRAALCVVVHSAGDVKNLLGRSVRTDRWAYTRWPDGNEQLFDHDADLSEMHNLAGDERHKATLDDLRSQLDRRLEEIGVDPTTTTPGRIEAEASEPKGKRKRKAADRQGS